jgi:hypothetical protein
VLVDMRCSGLRVNVETKLHTSNHEAEPKQRIGDI